VPGQIIIVTGSSGSGKSTACRTFAQRADEFYLMFGIDLFGGSMTPAKFTMHGQRNREGTYSTPIDPANPDGPTKMAFGSKGWTSIQAFHDMIAAASRAGQKVIVDHIMFLDPPILQDCIWRLNGLPVLFVGLQPSPDVLLDRIGSREIKVPPDFAETIGAEAASRVATNLRRLTPWFVSAINDNDCFDLVADSSASSPEEICDQIERRLAEGPGEAFDQLRKRYPKPDFAAV
jgi:chloramphenicol 3-O phosphotransferase